MKKTLLLISGFMLVATTMYAQALQQPSSEPPKEEFRSVWVATALGLDWPKITNVAEQQSTLRAIVRRHAEMRMNAIVFQVTARGDAHHVSDRLPWAIRLTGTMGQDPGWDPLQYVIDESKKYGLEVHAWYNVFNVGNTSELEAYAVANEPQHITKSNPDWVNTFGTSIWMNPGIPEARAWAVENVKELVENYDIDAVHFDFARYPEAFPGDTQRFQENNNGFTSIGDWRRNNVNQFQRDAYAAVQDLKPWVKIGTTPVGHYRSSAWPAGECPYAPLLPCSWSGFMAYDQVFQDAVAWVNEGLNDYIAPQLYWAIGPPGPHFEYLAQNWRDLTEESGKHVYIGIGAYKPNADDPNNKVAQELGIQVDTIRANNHAGHIFFRYDNIYGPGGPSNNFRDVAKIDYTQRAFVPIMDWKDMDVPPAVDITREMPVASVLDNSVTLSWEAPEFETASGDTKVSYAVYRVAAFSEPDPLAAVQDPANLLALTGETTYTDSPENTEGENYYYFVTPYSRNWVEGMPSNIVEFFTPTSIEDGDQLASEFKLDQNYPNPFNPSTQIRFTLGEATHATITVYDMMGRQVATLVDQSMAAGSHSVQFNASELSSGMYVYTLRAGSFTQTNKMMLVK